MGLFGFGKKAEPNYGAIFNKYYNSLSSMLISARFPLDDTILKFELLPFMNTVGILSVRAAQLDAVKFKEVTSTIINEKIKSLHNDEFFNYFEHLKRGTLYMDVATGDPYRGDWLMSTAFPLELRCHMVARCMVVFGDILLNPQCALEYSYKGLYLNGFTETFKVYSFMMENFYKLVLEYCKALTNNSNYVPMIRPEDLASQTK